MTDLSEIGAAVVGTGFIGGVHVEALRRLGVQVRGVVGSSPERARHANLGPTFDNFDAMLDDPRVDVVHITTPNHLHHDQAAAALKAGKHVVCEKPLAMTSAESADLLRIAEESGRVHAVNYNLRFYPLVQHVRRLVSAGELGVVRLVSGHYLQDWLLQEGDWNWRVDADLGGELRAVGDIGTHWMDVTSFLIGRKITAVMGDLATFIDRRNGKDVLTDDAATILLRYEDGARGALTVSQVSAGRKNSLVFEIDGAQAAVAWSSERPDELWIGHRGRPNEVLHRDPAVIGEAGGLPPGHVEGFAHTFKALYAAVYRAVAAGRPQEGYPTFSDGHDAMLVMEAVARSSRARTWQEVAR